MPEEHEKRTGWRAAGTLVMYAIVALIGGALVLALRTRWAAGINPAGMPTGRP